MPAAKRVRLAEDLATLIEVDNPNQKVDWDPCKAKAGRDLPTIRQLQLRLAPDDYNPGACFFFCNCPEPPCSPQSNPLICCGPASSGNHNVQVMVWHRGERECSKCL